MIPLTRDTFRRLLRFGFVGGLTFVVFYGLVFGMVDSMKMEVMLATGLAYIVAVVLNYGLHHAFTFERTTTHDYSIPRYLTVIAIGFSVNQALMYVGVHVAGLHYLLVQLASMVLIIVANYVAFQLWAFADSRT